MSSAFSVRDIRNIRQLAWATWRKCKGSSDQFRCVSREVLTLYTTIIEVEDDANDCASVLTRKGAGRNEELLAIVRGCEVTLNQLQELLESPNTVGANNNKSSDGIEFKNGVVDNMRGKLLYHSLTIGLFVTSLDPQALSRLGERIDDFAGKVRRGNKEDSAAAPYEDECEDVWELLKREVIEAGVSKDSVKRYKEDVKSCLKELISKDGKDEGTQNSPSVVESANTKVGRKSDRKETMQKRSLRLDMRPISNLGADQARNDSPSSASNGLSNLNESRSRAQCDEKVDRKQQESNWTSNNYPTTKGICDCTKSMLHQLGSKMPPQEAVPFPPPRFARHPRSETVAPDSPLSSTMPSTVETPTLFYPLKNFKPDSFEGILPGAWSCLCVVQSRPRPVLLFVDSAAGSGERRVFDKPPIAEKRYKTLLPRGWFRVENFHGRIWYWHLRSGIATYRHPAYNPRVKYRDGNLDIPPDPEGTEDSKDWDVNQYPHGMTNGFLDPDGAECQIATDIFHNKEHAMDLYLNRTPTSKEDSEAEEKLIARRTSFYFQPCHQRRSFRVSGDDPEFPRVSKGMFF